MHGPQTDSTHCTTSTPVPSTHDTQPDPDPPRVALGRRPVRVVLAEDDDDMRSLIACTLRRDGLAVTEVSTGSEMLDLVGRSLAKSARRAPFDLVISDVRMPGRTGLEVLEALRRTGWSTPVILITAFGSDTVHSEAYRLGAIAVFDKPFDVNALRLLARAVVVD